MSDASVASSRTIGLEVVITFPHVFEPQTPFTLAETPKYTLSALIAKSDAYQLGLIEQAINAAIQVKWRGRPPEGLTYPLHDGDTKNYAGYAGHIYFSPKSAEKPALFAWRDKQPATPSDVVSGYTGVISVTAFGFENRIKGVSFGLNTLWVIRRGERLDGRLNEAQQRDAIDRLISNRPLQIEGSAAEVPAGVLRAAGGAQGGSTAVERLLSGLGKPN